MNKRSKGLKQGTEVFLFGNVRGQSWPLVCKGIVVEQIGKDVYKVFVHKVSTTKRDGSCINVNIAKSLLTKKFNRNTSEIFLELPSWMQEKLDKNTGGWVAIKHETLLHKINTRLCSKQLS